MPGSSDSDAEPGDHRFNPQSASPALKSAMADLAEQTGRPVSEFTNVRLAEAYHLATNVYPDGLPDFWRVWQSWNVSSDEPPADMGDL